LGPRAGRASKVMCEQEEVKRIRKKEEFAQRGLVKKGKVGKGGAKKEKGNQLPLGCIKTR